MHTTRIFVESPLHCDEKIELPDAASHHISKVLRMRPDQKLHVFNGQGGYYTAVITAIGKRTVDIVPLEFIGEERESILKITLAQGISRGQHMDYTVQKAVELGVTIIVPLITEFCNVQLTGDRAVKKLAHWRSIVIHACEQCGRTRLPDILQPTSFRDWIDRDPQPVKIILTPTAGLTMKNVTVQEPEISLLTGPEGGFSETEINAATATGYQVVNLGSRILRTETAAVAAVCAVQVLWGDLG